jgi:hypothetical protein
VFRLADAYVVTRNLDVGLNDPRFYSSECNRQAYTSSLDAVKMTVTVCWVAKCPAVATSRVLYRACTVLWLINTSLK